MTGLLVSGIMVLIVAVLACWAVSSFGLVAQLMALGMVLLLVWLLPLAIPPP